MNLYEAINNLKGDRANKILIRGSYYEYTYDKVHKVFIKKDRRTGYHECITNLISYFNNDIDMVFMDWQCRT